MLAHKSVTALAVISVALALAPTPVLASTNECAALLQDVGAPDYKGDAPPHEILCRDGYVLSYNNETKVPDWALEVLTSEHVVGTADRNVLGNPFSADPDLKLAGVPYAKNADYQGSGCDRGHMAPAGDMKWSEQAMTQSFYLSNMAPQEGLQFNRGIWADLEDLARSWIAPRERLVVMSGPIYDGTARDSALAHATKPNKNCQKETIGEDVHVPNQFFKIVYSPVRKRVVAFVLPNRRLKDVDLADFRVSIREIEDLTGLNFFTALPLRTQHVLEDSVQPMWRH